MLVLLNGPPASGKSTIAGRLVDARPLALNLDIDVVRGQLGQWLDHPSQAGLAARALALSMIRTHLTAGHDVVVPQFLARSGFAEDLAFAAQECDARFVSIALMIDRATACSEFAARSARSLEPTHRDAAAMVERSETPDAIGEMFDRWVEHLGSQDGVHRIDAIRGEVDHTLERVEEVLRAPR